MLSWFTEFKMPTCSSIQQVHTFERRVEVKLLEVVVLEIQNLDKREV